MAQNPNVSVCNADIADMFDEFANLLAFEDANPFRIRAYRRGAQTVRRYEKPMADLIERGVDLTEIPTIGEELAALIDETVRTGRMQSLQALKQSTPTIAHDLLEIEGIGPKKARALWQSLGIGTLEQLHRAVLDHRIQDVPGFGKASEERLAKSLQNVLHPASGRMPLIRAEAILIDVMNRLRSAPGLKKMDVAGSYRRARETIGDLDIVAAAAVPREVIDHFINWNVITETIVAGEQRATVRLKAGLNVDLRVVNPTSYGAALLYFTGSKDHSIHLRTIAKRQGLKLNEYGLWRGEQRIAGTTEAEIYQKLGLQYIPPELRENRGEIELAKAGKLPSLVPENDVIGDLHLNAETPERAASLIEAAARKGWHYIGIGPHVPPDAPDERTILDLFAAIQKTAKAYPKLKVFSIAEVEIPKDGRLPLPKCLSGADIIIGAVQNGFRLSRDLQTERLIKAAAHPAISILSHPTGKRADLRAPYDVDLSAVAVHAAECGVALELSADPDRLDLSSWGCKIASEAGALISISTEAETPDELDRIKLGVKQARRGWLGPKSVLNTRSLPAIQRFVSRHALVSASLKAGQGA